MSNDENEANFLQQEQFLYSLNKEHIAKQRLHNDEMRNEMLKHRHQPHWLVCPKCGSKMFEINLMDIMIDRCTSCSGVYFDKGELDTLLHSVDDKGFFAFLKTRLM